jgi:hypothetical protein
MWTLEKYELVQSLIADGLSSRRVARLTGVPDSTIRNWRRLPPRVRQRSTGVESPWRPPDPPQYSYLLGLYLGDGHIAFSNGYPFLRLFLDRRYPGVVRHARLALQSAFPDAEVRRYDRVDRALTILQLSNRGLPQAFPQHGPGRKHRRRIALQDWQMRLTTADPRPFLRGLIHSDGCRCVNRFSVELPSGRTGDYEYVRYFFSNLSADIRVLFCEHCELLGIRWTQSNHRNISISHRRSVAMLDEFVGPKY